MRWVSMIAALAVFAAGFSLVQPAAAQAAKQTDGKDAAKQETPAAAPAQAPAAPAGAPMPDMVGVPDGPKVDATAIEDWRVECYDPAVNNIKCQMLQQLVERSLNKVVLITSLAYIPSADKAQIQIVLPLGFLLKRGVELKVGDYTSTVAVDRCAAQGCFVEGIAAPELINAFRTAKDAVVTIISETGQAVKVPFSVAGFEKAYAMIQEKNKAHAATLPKESAAAETKAEETEKAKTKEPEKKKGK